MADRNLSENSRRIARNTVLLYFRMFLLMAVGLYTSSGKPLMSTNVDPKITIPISIFTQSITTHNFVILSICKLHRFF